MSQAFRLIARLFCYVPATWHLGPNTRYPTRSDAEGRIPSTENDLMDQVTENAPIGLASCILYPASCILYPVSCILHPVCCILSQTATREGRP